jgi:glutaredoxin 3
VAKVEVYLTQWCPFCRRAVELLREKGQAFQAIDVEAEAGRRAEMIERSGRRTVPQIFIDGRHIGGCEDLSALELAGELDPLLAP